MKRIISILTACTILLAGCITALPVNAQDTQKKVVRVGWYESTYSYTDQFGRRCGVVYEYQQKIAAHTGWTYEYVDGSWPELLEMLKEGKIDLMSDVSYTEERAKSMLYSTLEMGTESYYIYIDAGNDEINLEDITSFTGKKIGVNYNSYQKKLLEEWIKKNEISPVIVELTTDEFESLNKVTYGELDAVVTMDSLNAIEKIRPVCEIGSSDYYFTVSKERPDLLNELNEAMTNIQDEDPYFNQRMMDEWINLTRTGAFLNSSIEKWLNKHGAIRVGYLEDYLPFCALDKSNNEVTGALKDFFAHASSCIKNANIKFTAVPYSSTKEALNALKKREIDCVFPVNISSYYGEENGIMKVAPVMHTDMSIMTRKDNNIKITPDSSYTVAIVNDSINYETFIKYSIPD